MSWLQVDDRRDHRRFAGMGALQVDMRRDLRRYAFNGFGADGGAPGDTTTVAGKPIPGVVPVLAPLPAPAPNPVLAWLNAKRQLDAFKSLSAPKPAVLVAPMPMPMALPAPAPDPDASERRGGRRGGGVSNFLAAGAAAGLVGFVLYRAFGRKR